MYNIEQTCCFTGKRPQFFSFLFNEEDAACIDLKERLKTAIEIAIGDGCRHFISGMALGCDLWAAEALLELKKSYAVTLECAIPFEDQPKSWTPQQKERYYHCLRLCDKKTLIQTHYSRDCFLKRNRYMVDHARLLIAVTDGSRRGGTAYTIQYAHEQAKEIRYILTHN